MQVTKVAVSDHHVTIVTNAPAVATHQLSNRLRRPVPKPGDSDEQDGYDDRHDP
jgi:hypothetical protein